MADLSDEELMSISSNADDRYSDETPKSEVARAVVELQRRRTEQTAGREHVERVVREVVELAVEWYGRPTAENVAVARTVARRVADRLSAPVPKPSLAERRACLGFSEAAPNERADNLDDHLAHQESHASVPMLSAGDRERLVSQLASANSALYEARIERDRALADSRALGAEADRLRALINTPKTDDFIDALQVEAAHQVERWGTEHDAGKQPADWFWLIGYLAGKALHDVRGKRVHHIIAAAAALLNWHRAETGESTAMRPGSDPDRLIAGAKP